MDVQPNIKAHVSGGNLLWTKCFGRKYKHISFFYLVDVELKLRQGPLIGGFVLHLWHYEKTWANPVSRWCQELKQGQRFESTKPGQRNKMSNQSIKMSIAHWSRPKTKTIKIDLAKYIKDIFIVAVHKLQSKCKVKCLNKLLYNNGECSYFWLICITLISERTMQWASAVVCCFEISQ